MKLCRKCVTSKPATREYWWRSKDRDGWQYYCKECLRSSHRKQRSIDLSKLADQYRPA